MPYIQGDSPYNLQISIVHSDFWFTVTSGMVLLTVSKRIEIGITS